MLKTIKCDCGFSAQEDGDDKLVAVVQKHAKDFHRMEMTPEQVLSMAQPVQKK